ncbi:methyltransferase [Mycobacterium intracellulare subsp. chimaera]|nr:methyltransferase [Mycobacterium intracellulare subsp. chimaera]ASQ86403.1 methyltransferase [Mycobacterium intracellulare subsp. chimaera]KPN48137.1 methyltransferase [Mycobacterium intracellulare subsp. chimaera]MCA2311236.1 class I SAM-dependent methyltransferase [Mycobacterium intracellulare subsp. chimaera]MCA2353775.1 class I SAM-dependent methyltransferase [Mycobacterium intracellulare subsp. chimaera]
MGLARKLRTGGHDHHSGWMITHPQAYEALVQVWYFGKRSQVWDRLVAASDAQSGERVLDVGCGTGYFARRIAPVVGPSGAVVGIDPLQPMLDYAAAHTPSNCTFHAAGAEDLPFEDGSFDLVVSSLSFHHIPPKHRADALREIFRVLRPGGRTFIADVRPPSIPILERLISVAHGHAEVHDLFDQLRDLATDAGFTAIRTGKVSRLHYVAAERPRE